MKTWLKVLVPLLILGGLIAWRWEKKSAPASGQRGGGMRGPASVELTVPQIRDIRKTFQATGTIESMQNVKISPTVSGRIEWLEVREGDHVTPGQILARIDPAEAQALVRQRQAELAEAKYRLAQAQLNQLPVDTAVAMQIQQQEANLTGATAELRQAEKTRTAQLDAITAAQDEAQSKVDNAVAAQASAETESRQAEQTRDAQVEAVKASLDDAQGKVDNAAASLAGAEVDARQAVQTRDAQREAVAATIDDARSKVETAKASVANAQNAVKSAQANLDNAVAKYNRAIALSKQGYVSTQNVDDAHTTVDVQQAALDTAKGQLQAAQTALNSTQAQQRAVEQQGNITRSKAESDVESTRMRVTQAKAALNSAQAQQRAVTQQANITRTKAESDVDTARARVTQTKAALATAQAQQRASAQQAKVTRAKVDADLDAAKVRVTQAKAILQNARANMKSSPAYQQNLEALKAGIAVAQASLDSAQSRLADTVLTSPMDGVVTARALDPGAMASVGQAILTVQSTHHLWVTVAVPDDVCVKLRLAQPATVAVDALSGRTFPARVAQINPSADPTSRQFTVRVVLDNAAKQFDAGMFARVTLETERALQTLAVPLEAVHQDRDGSSYVFAAGTDEKAHKRTVVTGISDADWIAIISGLKSKEKVVTMSAMPLRDGQAIRVNSGRRRGQGGRGGRGARSEQGASGGFRGPGGSGNADESGAPEKPDASGSGDETGKDAQSGESGNPGGPGAFRDRGKRDGANAPPDNGNSGEGRDGAPAGRMRQDARERE